MDSPVSKTLETGLRLTTCEGGCEPMTNVATTNGSTTDTTPEETIPDALAKGLLGVDASRRVGWAKAFDALRRVDAMEEDLRQTRAELRALRRAYSRLLGFIDNIPIRRSAIFKDEIRRHLQAERFFRHDDAWMEGWARSWDHKGQLHNWDQETIDAHKRRSLEDDQAKKAQLYNKRSNKAAIVRLYRAAEEQGHMVETMEFDGGETHSVCQCGESSGLRAWFETVTWRREHMAQVVTGMSWSEWEKKYLPFPQDTILGDSGSEAS